MRPQGLVAALPLSATTLTAFTLFAPPVAMAADAVVEVSDAFFTVLGDHAGRVVFVAAIAGVALIIPVWMASRAGGGVGAFKREEAAVIEGSRFPVPRLMASCASHGLACVERVTGSLMAGLAFRSGVGA